MQSSQVSNKKSRRKDQQNHQSEFWNLKAEIQNRQLRSYKQKILDKHQRPNQVDKSGVAKIKVEESEDSEPIEERRSKSEPDERLDILSKIIASISLAQQLNPWTLTSHYLESLGYDKITIHCQRMPKPGVQAIMKEVSFVSPTAIAFSNANQTLNSVQTQIQKQTLNSNIHPIYAAEASIPANVVSDKGSYVKIENVSSYKSGENPFTNGEQEQKQIVSQSPVIDGKLLKAQNGSQSQKTEKSIIAEKEQFLQNKRGGQSRGKGPVAVHEYQIEYNECQPNENSPWQQEEEKVYHPKRLSKLLQQEEQTDLKPVSPSSLNQQIQPGFEQPAKRRLAKTRTAEADYEQTAKYKVGQQKPRRQPVESSFEREFNSLPRKSPRLNRKLCFDDSPIHPHQTALKPNRQTRQSKAAQQYNTTLSPRLNSDNYSEDPCPAATQKVSLQIQTSPARTQSENKQSFTFKDGRNFKRPRGRPFGWRKKGPNAPQYYMPPPKDIIQRKKKNQASHDRRHTKTGKSGNFILPHDLLEYQEEQYWNDQGRFQKKKYGKCSQDFIENERLGDDIFHSDDDNSANFVVNFEQCLKQVQNRTSSPKKFESPVTASILQKDLLSKPQQQNKSSSDKKSGIDCLLERIMTRAKDAKKRTELV